MERFAGIIVQSKAADISQLYESASVNLSKVDTLANEYHWWLVGGIVLLELFVAMRLANRRRAYLPVVSFILLLLGEGTNYRDLAVIIPSMFFIVCIVFCWRGPAGVRRVLDDEFELKAARQQLIDIQHNLDIANNLSNDLSTELSIIKANYRGCANVLLTAEHDFNNHRLTTFPTVDVVHHNAGSGVFL
ncbi:MAG: hypothetical protein EOP05_01695 [Proteobacteria bacterium]|nr:MAG: hypothetical protein EOP05_01695 [Pseudomonadota bacterium]